MREFCEMYWDFLSYIPDEQISECGYMPESCVCDDCPYFKFINPEA